MHNPARRVGDVTRARLHCWRACVRISIPIHVLTTTWCGGGPDVSRRCRSFVDGRTGGVVGDARPVCRPTMFVASLNPPQRFTNGNCGRRIADGDAAELTDEATLTCGRDERRGWRFVWTPNSEPNSRVHRMIFETTSAPFSPEDTREERRAWALVSGANTTLGGFCPRLLYGTGNAQPGVLAVSCGLKEV
ncbi:unnamed protein product [Heligmosomoides polygyrus]|uniref:DUF3293 domain-containing protein n=1 Tax=Heligmosomoides polygyrus TaxID=6339 RepID=A0A183FNL7_HELPZ|nr:unnamed protein product [Heligmosomoides polygyrus]